MEEGLTLLWEVKTSMHPCKWGYATTNACWSQQTDPHSCAHSCQVVTCCLFARLVFVEPFNFPALSDPIALTSEGDSSLYHSSTFEGRPLSVLSVMGDDVSEGFASLGQMFHNHTVQGTVFFVFGGIYARWPPFIFLQIKRSNPSPSYGGSLQTLWAPQALLLRCGRGETAVARRWQCGGLSPNQVRVAAGVAAEAATKQSCLALRALKVIIRRLQLVS